MPANGTIPPVHDRIFHRENRNLGRDSIDGYDMQLNSIPKMINLILSAKPPTHANGMNKLLPYHVESHDLQLFKDDWAYHDRYRG